MSMTWATARELTSLVLMGLGVAFFVAGLVGLLRFPDVYARVHALTKTDTLGLGFVALGVAIMQPGALLSLRVLLIWALVALASGANGHFLCRAAYLEDRERAPRGGGS